MNHEAIAGHHFYGNGDLMIAVHADPFLIYRVYGFRQGEKLTLEQWAERRCPSCGCPAARYHSIACRLRKETP